MVNFSRPVEGNNEKTATAADFDDDSEKLWIDGAKIWLEGVPNGARKCHFQDDATNLSKMSNFGYYKLRT